LTFGKRKREILIELTRKAVTGRGEAQHPSGSTKKKKKRVWIVLVLPVNKGEDEWGDLSKGKVVVD